MDYTRGHDLDALGTALVAPADDAPLEEYHTYPMQTPIENGAESAASGEIADVARWAMDRANGIFERLPSERVLNHSVFQLHVRQRHVHLALRQYHEAQKALRAATQYLTRRCERVLANEAVVSPF